MQDPMLRQFAASYMGMTEEDMDKISPEWEAQLKNAVERMANYRLVAEVVSAKYCAAGLQAGQRFVVERGQSLNPAESTAPFCVGAIAPLVTKTHTMLDRIYTGAAVTAHIPGCRCTDCGIDLGGLGTVEMRVRIEEVE